MKSKVMYLDVDDTLLVWSNDARGIAAPRAAEFVLWAIEHFEVRWLTMWCPVGNLLPTGAEELSKRFNRKVSPEIFLSIQNPRSFEKYKTDAIDFDDSRPWVWVEDAILYPEQAIMNSKGLADRFYKTNVTHNVVMLQKTWKLLAERFDLPGPSLPYEIKMEYPLALLEDDNKIDQMINNFQKSGFKLDIGST